MSLQDIRRSPMTHCLPEKRREISPFFAPSQQGRDGRPDNLLEQGKTGKRVTHRDRSKGASTNDVRSEEWVWPSSDLGKGGFVNLVLTMGGGGLKSRNCS